MYMRSSLLTLRPTQHASVRIVCFPYAGGTAAFTSNWSRLLPEHVELLGVRYPTPIRETQATVRTPQRIADEIMDEIVALPALPVVFFGYSLGALIAYETSVRWSQRGLTTASALVVAAARAPHLPRRRAKISHLPDNELIDRLRDYGGTPAIVLEDKELMSVFLPSIRADLSTAENYQFEGCPPLACPVTAIGGTADSMVDMESVAEWRLCTIGSFDLIQLEAGHFFLKEKCQSLISIIARVAQNCAHAEGAAVL
jgi:medium-chain acyl-[acyl-carrier-protein] hydrolase